MDNYRQQLDTIDTELLALLSRRMAVSRKIGDYKHANKLPVQDKAREAALRARIRQLAELYGLDSKFVLALYELILAESKYLQNH